jgi:hypothetical protein
MVPTRGSSQAGSEEEVRDQWKRIWEKTRTSGPTKKLVKAPTKKTLQPYNNLPESHSSVLLADQAYRPGP